LGKAGTDVGIEAFALPGAHWKNGVSVGPAHFHRPGKPAKSLISRLKRTWQNCWHPNLFVRAPKSRAKIRLIVAL
jgi:hypothetical protein